MKQSPAFQFYVSEYLSSSKVQSMTLEAQGAYVRLLCYNWQDGYIPADVGHLSSLCGCTPRKMALLWDGFLRVCFMPLASDPDKLVNPKLEDVRQRLIEFKEKKSTAGIKGAAKTWQDHKRKDGTAINVPLADGMANDGSLSPSSSLSPNTGEVKNTSPGPAPAERPKDPAYELFAKAHQETLDAVYVSKQGDFVQLAALRKANSVNGKGSPPHWAVAVSHYFSSDLSGFTLADLCSKYAMFRNGPVDRYGKLGGRNERESDAQGKQRRTAEAGRTLTSLVLRKLDEETSGGVPAGDQPGDASNVSEKSLGFAAGSS